MALECKDQPERNQPFRGQLDCKAQPELMEHRANAVFKALPEQQDPSGSADSKAIKAMLGRLVPMESAGKLALKDTWERKVPDPQGHKAHKA
jgi:hypothetical protein